jgi:hypothetical protein
MPQTSYPPNWGATNSPCRALALRCLLHHAQQRKLGTDCLARACGGKDRGQGQCTLSSAG